LLLFCASLAVCLSSYADDCPQYAQNCAFLNHEGQFSSYAYGNNQGTAFSGINDAGDIVGFANVASGQDGLYIHNGTATLFSYPGAGLTVPDDINNNGVIVGFWGITAYNPHHGMLYSQGNFSSFDYPGAMDTYGGGINDAGQIAGTYSDDAGKFHGFLKDGDTFTSIDYPGLHSGGTQVWGVNNLGQAVGFYQNGVSTYGFVDSGGVFTDLSFPGGYSTVPWDINDNGEVVGYYLGADGHSHGFLYYDGKYSSVDYGYDIEIFGVNNAGDFVGTFMPHQVPEPSSIVLMTTAILGSFGVKRFLL
jgi:probable HAF family extracellular repeat protein